MRPSNMGSSSRLPANYLQQSQGVRRGMQRIVPAVPLHVRAEGESESGGRDAAIGKARWMTNRYLVTGRTIFSCDSVLAQHTFALALSLPTPPQTCRTGSTQEPRALHSRLYEKMAESNGKPTKCLIVGAGPVGALAALYAANRGWHVELYELRGGLYNNVAFKNLHDANAR